MTAKTTTLSAVVCDRCAVEVTRSGDGRTLPVPDGWSRWSRHPSPVMSDIPPVDLCPDCSNLFGAWLSTGPAT